MGVDITNRAQSMRPDAFTSHAEGCTFKQRVVHIQATRRRGASVW